MRLPGLGGWSDDPLWGSVYDWTVEHPRVGGALWALGVQSDLRLLYAAAGEIGRQPEGARVLDVPCGGGVAVRSLHPDQGVDYVAVDISQKMLDRTRAVAEEVGVAEQVTTQVADVEALPFEDQAFDLVVSFTGLHCFPDPAARRGRAGPGDPRGRRTDRAARCSTTPAGATSRCGAAAGWPGCSARGAPRTRSGGGWSGRAWAT